MTSDASMSTAFVKAIVVPPSRDRFLVQRRSKRGDRYHGFWELPGGRIHPGESVHQCLCREVEEETGLQVQEILGQSEDRIEDRLGGRARVLLPLVVVEVIASGAIFGQYYVCLVRGEARDTEESSSHRWFLVPEFRQTFLEAPGPNDELSTVDLLALRVVFRDRLLEPLLR
jgi:8-oxo-dGTP pyrophosphatase MutT (NUDIX family)